jgi:hypothetical protein
MVCCANLPELKREAHQLRNKRSEGKKREG